MPQSSQTPMTPERLAEIKDLLKYESSIAFYSHRAKESMLLLVAEAEDAARLRELAAVPRTERSYWLAIADALNAAESAGMAVGIDLDGTLTDHNAWSVIWDRAAKQWVLAGYDAEGGAA